jgi:hypothetical protein
MKEHAQTMATVPWVEGRSRSPARTSHVAPRSHGEQLAGVEQTRRYYASRLWTRATSAAHWSDAN